MLGPVGVGVDMVMHVDDLETHQEFIRPKFRVCLYTLVSETGVGIARPLKVLVVNKKTTPADRNDAIELLRYACAVGIVWFHLGGPKAWIGHAALIVFITLSVVFALGRNETSWNRIRVLKLWLFWSVIYAGLKIVQLVVLKQPFGPEFQWWMLATGPILPLWFLPFIYIANGLATFYNTSIAKKPNWVEMFAFPCLAVGFTEMLSLSPGIPFSQWFLGTAGLCVAMSVYWAQSDVRYLIASLSVLSGAFFLGIGHEVEMLLLASITASIVLLYVPIWKSHIASVLGSISLGIYLLHHGVHVVLKGVMNSQPVPIQILLVVACSTGLALLLKRLPVFRNFI